MHVADVGFLLNVGAGGVGLSLRSSPRLLLLPEASGSGILEGFRILGTTADDINFALPSGP